jgi:hypothetical protein
MTKVFLGNQDGQSSSDVSLDTDGNSGLEIRGGDLHEQAKQKFQIRDRSGTREGLRHSTKSQ